MNNFNKKFQYEGQAGPGSLTGIRQANMSKIQGLFKDFSRLSYSFQGPKV